MSKFALALSAPALALGAVTAAADLSGTAVAQPVSQVRVVHAQTTASVQLAAATSVRLASAHRHHHTRLAPKQIAWQMMHAFRWRARFQFKYVNWLWSRESSWNVHASNPYSGAYGIPQAVPGSKMSTAGPNWTSSATTQIRWGFRYIRDRYGSPRAAWAHECAYGWY